MAFHTLLYSPIHSAMPSYAPCIPCCTPCHTISSRELFRTVPDPKARGVNELLHVTPLHCLVYECLMPVDIARFYIAVKPQQVHCSAGHWAAGALKGSTMSINQPINHHVNQSINASVKQVVSHKATHQPCGWSPDQSSGSHMSLGLIRGVNSQ